MENIELIRALFYRLEPKTTESIQLYNSMYHGRQCCTFGIKSKTGQWSTIFQFFKGITRHRQKLIFDFLQEHQLPLKIQYISKDIVVISYTQK
ncbi:MAG: hypothetical protein RL607_1609 [Bacteroidota bacterium]|jgi:hypothetical protein